MVEGRQPLDPILQVQLVPLADRVVIEKQYFADRRAAQAIVQQNKRVGAAGEPMRGGAVAGQVDQVARDSLSRKRGRIMRGGESTLGGFARGFIRIFVESGQ